MLLTLLQSGGVGPGVITGSMAAVESGPDVMAASGFIFNDGDSSKSVRFAIRQFVADNPSRNLTARRNAGLITRRREK
jgi:hypothetical protein